MPGDMRGPQSLAENQRDLYQFGIQFDQNLSIAAFQADIVEKIANNPITLVHGATGCGKTTQIPQYILGDCISKGNVPYIVVTQPRRIAAVSIARHVCQERQWEFGGLVGYQIGQDSLFCDETRILYCTLGVFLEKLCAGQGLDQMTHVVLDEMHEREEEMDLALLLIKKLQQGSRRNIKIIVMSATMEIDKFITYLGHPPVVEITTGMFDVYIKYLEDITGSNDYGFSLDEPRLDGLVQNAILNLVLSFDELEMNSGNDKSKGVVLVFVPGIREISDLMAVFHHASLAYNVAWDILPLHSTVGRREQDRVFAYCPPSLRRIIVSTNIAESSVTIPDVRYVVDTCLTKQLTRDETSAFTALRLTWASKSNCDQRKGRTGRLSTGTVYRMIPRQFYQMMEPHAVPEMLRIPLHQTILKIKTLAIPGTIYDILLDAVDPPEAITVRQSVLELIEAGALSLGKGVTDPQQPDGNLTTIGRIMSSLPLDLPLKRLIILAIAFGCVDEAIIIAGCLQSRSFLDVRFQDHDLDSFKMKIIWDNGGHSDLLAVLCAFQTWETQKASVFAKKPEEERKWCSSYSLNCSRINEAAVLIEDLRQRIQAHGLYALYTTGTETKQSFSSWSLPTEDINQRLLLQIVIAGAFYPNYFVAEGNRDNRMAIDVPPADPRTIFLGIDPLKSAQLSVDGVNKFFLEHIKCMPKSVRNDGKGRVHVTFRQDGSSADSDVPLPVHLALRLRLNRLERSAVRRVIEPPTATAASKTLFLPRALAHLAPAKTQDKVVYGPVEFEGPYQELELLNFKAVTPDVQFRKVRVSKSSVNSVVVNTAADTRISRILVAATVKAGEGLGSLNIDNTTLLPAETGLLDIISVLFAPSLKLLHYTGSSTPVSYKAGIGQTMGSPAIPLWKEHEIERNFEVKYTDEQMLTLLELRSAWRFCFSDHLYKDVAWRQRVLPKSQQINRRMLQCLLSQDVVAV